MNIHSEYVCRSVSIGKNNFCPKVMFYFHFFYIVKSVFNKESVQRSTIKVHVGINAKWCLWYFYDVWGHHFLFYSAVACLLWLSDCNMWIDKSNSAHSVLLSQCTEIYCFVISCPHHPTAPLSLEILYILAIFSLNGKVQTASFSHMVRGNLTSHFFEEGIYLDLFLCDLLNAMRSWPFIILQWCGQCWPLLSLYTFLHICHTLKGRDHQININKRQREPKYTWNRVFKWWFYFLRKKTIQTCIWLMWKSNWPPT